MPTPPSMNDLAHKIYVVHEPLPAGGRGAAALTVIAVWLRRALRDMRFAAHEIAVIDDRAIAGMHDSLTLTRPARPDASSPAEEHDHERDDPR